MRPVQSSLRKFKVFENAHYVLLAACDKHDEEWHVLKFERRGDAEQQGGGLRAILNEELAIMTKEEFMAYISNGW